MDNMFKEGNYLRYKGDSEIFQVIVENPTQEDEDKYLPSEQSWPNIMIVNLSDIMIVKRIGNGEYDWYHKDSRSFELVKYMNTPLWKALEG